MSSYFLVLQLTLCLCAKEDTKFTEKSVSQRQQLFSTIWWFPTRDIDSSLLNISTFQEKLGIQIFKLIIYF